MTTKKRVDLERELSKAEKEVRRAKERLAKLQRRLPPLEMADYALAGPGGEKVTLSSLFGKHDDLILVHNMGKSCPYCTMWADGFNGVLKHLESRGAFVVVSPDPPEVEGKFAEERGWKFRMVSGQGSTFTKDLGFERKDGSPIPGVSAFHREKDGRIVRIGKAQFGPGDDFCSVWHLFDLLPNGSNGWEPKFRY